MAPIDATQPAGSDRSQAASGFNPYQQDAYSAATDRKTDSPAGKTAAADASLKSSDAPELLTPDAVRALNNLFLNLLNVCGDDKVDRAQLIKELQQAQFGPNVQRALNDCAKLLQSDVKINVQALIERGLDFPAGVPVVMPRDISGRAVGDQLLREEIRAGKTVLNFAGRFDHAPSAEDVNKLFAAGVWSTDALNLLRSANLHYQVDQLAQKIQEFNPKEANGVGPRDQWLPAANLTDAQREQWLYAAAPWTQTMMEVRNYAETIANLNKATGDASSTFRISELGNKLFPDEALSDENFPGKVDRYASGDVVVVGANGFPIHYRADQVVSSNKNEVVVRDDNGQQHTYKQSEVKKMSAGEIVSIHFDLPDTLDRTPENLAKMQKMQDWLDKYSGPVNQAFQEIVKGCADNGRILLWGDAPSDGETKDHQKFNLVEHRFTAGSVTVTTPDGNQEERIRVCGQVQDQYATWCSYQGWGVVNNVGEPARTGISTLNGKNIDAGSESYIGTDGTTVGADAANKAATVKVDTAGGVSIKDSGAQPGIFINGMPIPKDQWIALNPTDKITMGPKQPVNLNVEVRLYKPDDWVTIMQNGRMQIMQAKDLQAWANEAKAWHYGEKIVSTAMDVGMVLTGSIELKAAWVAAGKVAAEVAAKELLEQTGKAAIGEVIEGAGKQTARAAFRDTLSQALRSGAFYKALWHGGFYGLGGLGRQAIINGGDTVGGWLGDPKLGSQIETGRNWLMMADLTWNNTFIGSAGKKMLGLQQAGNAEKVVKAYIDAEKTAAWVKNTYNLTHSGLGWLQIGLGADIGYNRGMDLLDRFNQLDSSEILRRSVGKLGNPYHPSDGADGTTVFDLADDATRNKVDTFANVAAAVRILSDDDPRRMQVVSQLGDMFTGGSDSDKLAAAYALMSLSKPGADGQPSQVLSSGHDDRPAVKLQDVKNFLDTYTPLQVGLLNSDLRKKFDAAAAEVDAVKTKPDNDFTKVREIEKLSATFLDSDNADDKLIAALALVRLQRRADGSLPKIIGHRQKERDLTDSLKVDEVQNFLHSYRLRNLSAMDKQSEVKLQQRMHQVEHVSKEDRSQQLQYIQQLSKVFVDKSTGADDKMAAAAALMALSGNGDQSDQAIVGGCADAKGKMHAITREEVRNFVDSYASLTLAEQLGAYTKDMNLSDRAGAVKATQDALLLAPDQLDRQAQVKKLSDVYTNSYTNDDDKVAAAIGLLLLARSQANGSIPDVLGSYEYVDADSGEKTKVEVSTKDVFAYLKEESRTAASAGTRMAAGDILVRCNQTDLTEYGAICQAVLRDPKSTAEQKMAALFDPHGMRLGEIVDLLKHSTEPAADRSQQEKQQYESGSFGCDSQALEATLHAIVRDPNQDKNVRAMAGMVLRIADIDDEAERKRLQDTAQKAWADTKTSNDPNAFVNSLVSTLEGDLRSADQSADSKKKRISAALLLSDILDGNEAARKAMSSSGTRDQSTGQAGHGDPAAAQPGSNDPANATKGGGGQSGRSDSGIIPLTETKQVIDDTLLSGMRGASSQPAIALRVLPLLLERMAGMTDSQRQSLRSAADFILKMPISATAGAAEQTKLEIALIKDLPALYAGAGADATNKECDTLKRLLTAGDHLFATQDKIRAQAISTLALIASNDAAGQSFLKGIISGAGADPSPAVRLAALNALQRFHPDDIHDFCFRLLTQEKDAEVLKAARTYEYADRTVDEHSPEYRKQFEIARKEMLDSAWQDLSGVLDQVDQRYPLLDGAKLRQRQLELHIAEYYEGVSGFVNWTFSRQKTIDAHELATKRQVFDEMKAQFDQLVSDSKQNSEQGHQARDILAYIILSNGRPFMAGSGHEADDTKSQTNGAIQSDRSWAVQAAANALVDLTKSTDPQVQKDAAWMTELCLTSQPTMSRDIRQQVLQALLNLHPGSAGSPVSKEGAGLAILSAVEQEFGNCPKSDKESDYTASRKLQSALLDAYKSCESPLGLPILAAITGDGALIGDAGKTSGTDPDDPIAPPTVHARLLADYPMPDVQAKALAIIDELQKQGAAVSGDSWNLSDQQKYETAKAELMRGGQRQIKDMNADWFGNNGYELLDSRRLPDQEKQALESAKPGFFEWLFSSSEELDQKYDKALDDLYTRLNQQLTNLESAAKQVPSDGDSDKALTAARSALGYIILSNGDPFSDKDRAAATERAAGTIYDICKSQGPKAGDLDWMLKEALIEHPELPATSRELLAKALSYRVSEPDQDGKVPQGSMSREQAATICAAALETEYAHMPQPGQPGFKESEELQKTLLCMLRDYQCRSVYPALEAMAQVNPSNDVMQMAGQTLALLRDRIQPLAAETVPDRRSAPDLAARELDNLLHLSTNVDDKCRAILRLCPLDAIASGLPDGSDDPRVAILRSALNDKDERVRLTAAYCLVNSSNINVQTDALVVLNDISLNGTRSGFRQDARDLLAAAKQVIDPVQWQNSIEPKFQEAIEKKAESDRQRAQARKDEQTAMAKDLESHQTVETKQAKDLRQEIDTVSRLGQDDAKRGELRHRLSALFYSGDPQTRLVAARGLLALAKPGDDVVGTRLFSTGFFAGRPYDDLLTGNLPDPGSNLFDANDPLLRLSDPHHSQLWQSPRQNQFGSLDWLAQDRASTVGGGGTTRDGYASGTSAWVAPNVSGRGGSLSRTTRSPLGFNPMDLNITREEVEDFIASRADQIAQLSSSIKDLPADNLLRQHGLEEIEHSFQIVTTTAEMTAAAKAMLALKADAQGNVPDVLTSTEVSLNPATGTAVDPALAKTLQLFDPDHRNRQAVSPSFKMPSAGTMLEPGSMPMDGQTAKMYQDWMMGTLPPGIEGIKRMSPDDPRRVRCERQLLLMLQTSPEPAQRIAAARSLMALAPHKQGKLELFPSLAGAIDIPPIGQGWSTRLRVSIGSDGLPHCFVETPTASVRQFLGLQGPELMRQVAASGPSDKALIIDQCARVFVESQQPEDRLAAAIGLLSLNANDDNNAMPYELGSDNVISFEPYLGLSHKTVSPQQVYSFLNDQLKSHTMLSFVAARGLIDAHHMTQEEFHTLCQAISQDADAPADARKRANEELAKV